MTMPNGQTKSTATEALINELGVDASSQRIKDLFQARYGEQVGDTTIREARKAVAAGIANDEPAEDGDNDEALADAAADDDRADAEERLDDAIADQPEDGGLVDGNGNQVPDAEYPEHTDDELDDNLDADTDTPEDVAAESVRMDEETTEDAPVSEEQGPAESSDESATGESGNNDETVTETPDADAAEGDKVEEPIVETIVINRVPLAGRCNHRMPRAATPDLCGRPEGHPGVHTTYANLTKKKAYSASRAKVRYHTDPAYRDRAKSASRASHKKAREDAKAAKEAAAAKAAETETATENNDAPAVKEDATTGAA